MWVICNKAQICEWHKQDIIRGHGCGAAVPHLDYYGCEPCPVFTDAKCVPTAEE